MTKPKQTESQKVLSKGAVKQEATKVGCTLDGCLPTSRVCTIFAPRHQPRHLVTRHSNDQLLEQLHDSENASKDPDKFEPRLSVAGEECVVCASRQFRQLEIHHTCAAPLGLCHVNHFAVTCYCQPSIWSVRQLVRIQAQKPTLTVQLHAPLLICLVVSDHSGGNTHVRLLSNCLLSPIDRPFYHFVRGGRSTERIIAPVIAFLRKVLDSKVQTAEACSQTSPTDCSKKSLQWDFYSRFSFRNHHGQFELSSARCKGH